MLFYLRMLTWWFILDVGWVVNSLYWGDSGLSLEKQNELTATRLQPLQLLATCGVLFNSLISNLSLKPETNLISPFEESYQILCLIHKRLLYIYLPTEETINWISGANLLKNVINGVLTLEIFYIKGPGMMTC